MKWFNSIKSLIKSAILITLFTSIMEARDNFTLNMYKQTMKPYIVKGIKYYPTSVKIGDIFRGVASWYGEYFHGKFTASGEKYNMYNYTAAHKTLPLNTLIKVINVKNRKTVTVRVNDRGPFVKKRHLDLSYAAARKLGIIDQGVSRIKIKILSTHLKKKKRVMGRLPKPKINNNHNIKVQIASFSTKKRTKSFIKKQNIGRLSPKIIKVRRDNIVLYKVVVTNFKSQKEAKRFVRNSGFDGAYIINL